MQSIPELFHNLKKLPTLPIILVELMETFSNENVEIDEVAGKVAKDLSISAKVICMANSAAFRRGKEVESVKQALIRLGVNQVRSIVIAASLSNTFPDIPGFDKDKFWKDSFTIATIAKNIAKHTQVNHETAFTCAMMHNIGELLLQLLKPNECALIKESIEAGESRLSAQHQIFGFDYLEVGVALAKHWNFSAIFCDAIEQQLDPLSYDEPSQAAILIRLSISSNFALSANMPVQMVLSRFPQPLIEAIDLDMEGLLGTFTAMQAEMELEAQEQST